MSNKKMTYEDAVKEINGIIKALESGEITLDETVKEYEKANNLLQFCREELDSAQGKIKQIKEKKGKIVTEDF